MYISHSLYNVPHNVSLVPIYSYCIEHGHNENSLLTEGRIREDMATQARKSIAIFKNLYTII